MKKKLRGITVEGKTFLWMVRESYILLTGVSPAYGVTLEVTVFMDGYKNTPLSAGWAFPISSSGKQIKPADIRGVILKGISDGWVPERAPYSLGIVIEVSD